MRIVYDDIGGHPAFAAWARANPTEFYKIAARLIPSDVNVKADNTLTVIVNRGVGSADLLPPAACDASAQDLRGVIGLAAVAPHRLSEQFTVAIHAATMPPRPRDCRCAFLASSCRKRNPALAGFLLVTSRKLFANAVYGGRQGVEDGCYERISENASQSTGSC